MQLLLISNVLILVPCFAYAACEELDRDALLSLLFKAPLNWSASDNCCFWDGITYDPLDHRRVIRLWLSKRGISCVISSAITNLTHLTHLNLSHNSLLGSLLDDLLSSLPNLQQQQLFRVNTDEQPQQPRFPYILNSLSGPIGDGIINLTNLNILELFSNLFAGPIPTHIGSLFKLETLLLHINNFTCPLPFQVGNTAPPTSYR
ncbi:hypothetical protein C1H46_002208 [Malus baccata]|uniref:Leucine-rich repeat-containing N-terminal plant-type domain-containing protein n=1 Tax=Malus baccata TaxID=106549 RepID=A0A540NM80_MALBA|nr:hypothetical protein C1H46_002208 [Malus baccata]